MPPIYVELVGLPGSGKTSLLAALKKNSANTSGQLKTAGAPSTLGAYRKYVLGMSEAPGYSPGIKPWLRATSPLGWNDWCQAQHPEIFSLVFDLLQEVPNEWTSRQQVLNFWRVRLSEFTRISESEGASVVLTDEGLAQALFGTLMRSQALPSLGVDFIERFTAVLPKARAVIFVNTPLEVAVARSVAGKSKVGPFTNEHGQACVTNIWAHTRRVVDHTFEVDGSVSPAENAQIVLAKLSSLTRGEI